ncbi:hypothetical protein ONE63_001757 [Megalurothrips usitatus]|uniref:Uncharacterized protein n=1 Tax=Megalurothrips usitatus TaxID=439358 RepID=A0AAV7X9E4_9NEOP|nr:hypothetical protein ONE63_001757 [Megalurothrips usitatus]
MQLTISKEVANGEQTGGMTETCWNAGGGAVVKMEHFQPALDPRKQELLEMRFTGAKIPFGREASPASDGCVR